MPYFPRRRGQGGRILGLGLVVVAAALGLGWVVMALWNAILPGALHTGPLSYWQGLGLLVLCRLLFGGWGRGGEAGPGRRGPGFEKWERLSPDERQQFRQRWQGRRFGPAADEGAEG